METNLYKVRTKRGGGEIPQLLLAAYKREFGKGYLLFSKELCGEKRDLRFFKGGGYVKETKGNEQPLYTNGRMKYPSVTTHSIPGSTDKKAEGEVDV